MLRIDFGHHSAAADCPISVKFCVEKQFFLQKFGNGQKYPRFLFS